MINYIHRVKTHLKFDKKEVRFLFALIILVTFVLGYDDGYQEFIFSRWFFNLLTSFVVATSVVLVKEVSQKLMAIKRGYTSKMTIWWRMYFLVFVISFLLRGQVHILLPMTGLLIKHDPKMRIGQVRYGHNYYDNALIAFAGIMGNIYFALLLKTFSFLPNPTIIMAMEMHIMYALVNLLPLDMLFVLINVEHVDIRKHPAPFTGTYLYYGARYLMLFTIISSIFMALSIFFVGIVPSIVLGLLVGFISITVIGFPDYK